MPGSASGSRPRLAPPAPSAAKRLSLMLPPHTAAHRARPAGKQPLARRRVPRAGRPVPSLPPGTALPRPLPAAQEAFTHPRAGPLPRRRSSTEPSTTSPRQSRSCTGRRSLASAWCPAARAPWSSTGTRDRLTPRGSGACGAVSWPSGGVPWVANGFVPQDACPLGRSYGLARATEHPRDLGAPQEHRVPEETQTLREEWGRRAPTVAEKSRLQPAGRRQVAASFKGKHRLESGRSVLEVIKHERRFTGQEF